jgi:hypothetical protein
MRIFGNGGRRTYSFSSIIFFINSFDMELLIEISHGILPHDIIGPKEGEEVRWRGSEGRTYAFAIASFLSARP